MRFRTELKSEKAGMTNRTEKTDIINTRKRMKGIHPSSFNPNNATNATNAINAINAINANNAKESEVRTVMGGSFGRRIYNILNLKSAISNLKLLRTALMAVLIVAVVLGLSFGNSMAASQVCTTDTTTYNYNDYWDSVIAGYGYQAGTTPNANPSVTQFATDLAAVADSGDNQTKYSDQTTYFSNGSMDYDTTNKPKAEYQWQAGKKYKFSWDHMTYNVDPSTITQFAVIYYYYPKKNPIGNLSLVVEAYSSDNDSIDTTINLDGAGNYYVIYTPTVNTSNCTGMDDKGNTGVTVNYFEVDLTPLMSRLAAAGYTTVNLRLMAFHDDDANNPQVQFFPQEVELAVTIQTDNTPPTEVNGTLTISPDDGTYTGPDFTITEDFSEPDSSVTSCEYTIDGGTNWAAGSVSGTGPTYTCTANVTGATGTVTVLMRATSAGGTSTPTNSLTRTVDNTPPTDGTLTATPGNAQVSLSWTAASDGESGLASTNTYRVVYDTAGTPADCNSGTQIYQGTGTSYVHTGLTNGTTYYYRVCATDAMGNESQGATASATPVACQATAPTDLQATNVTSSQVDLQWTADCANNDTYNVYRDGTQIASGLTCSTGTMTYSDTTVSPSTTYTYTVRGYNNAGTCESGDSNAVQVTTQSGPVFHITSCTDCHGQPPAEGTTRQRGPGYPSIGGGQVIGSHAAHVTSHGIACTECHIDNGTNLNHRNGVIEFQASIRGGSYSPNDTDVDTNGFPLQDVEDGSGLGSCSNTGCHGQSSPTWGQSTGLPTCYQCHGTQANGNNAPSSTTDTPSGNANKVGAHQAHLQGLNGYTAGIQCNECHNVPTDAMSTGHLYDGTNDTTLLEAEINFGNIADGGDDNQAPITPTYDYTQQTCDVYCHNGAYFKNGFSSGNAPTPAWNDSNYLTGVASHDCAQCHGYPPDPTQGHPNDSNCHTCHSHVKSTDDGFLPASDPSGGITLHVNGIVEGGGDCLGCHLNSTQNGVRRAVAGDFQKTSHHVATGTPTDVNTCMACHGDLITDKGHSATATSDPTVEVEDADNAGTYYTIDPSTADANLATFCLSCHDADGATRLGADALQPFVSSGDTTAPPNIADPWSNTTNFPYNHSAGATCNDCHGNAAGSTTDTLNPDYNLHGSSAPKILRATNQYDVCFQCHNATINKTNLASETYIDNNFSGGGIYQSNWNTIPNIQSQFATTNYAYHPLLGTGRNQPADTDNQNAWVNDNARKVDNATACPDGTCTGLDNNFVDGWESTSLVTCTDCHEDNSGLTTAKGPHGSAQPWILKGMDTTVTVTTVGGTVQPNANAPVQNSYIASNFCVNCHRADIYGWGSKNNVPNPNYEYFSRLGHLGVSRNNAMRIDCQATDAETGQGGYRNIGCMNCHGGGEVAGIHGSNLGVGNAGTDAMGKRFMNGNSWQGHTLGDTNGSSVGCYTGNPPAIGQTMSSCAGKHTGGKTMTPYYYYQWQ